MLFGVGDGSSMVDLGNHITLSTCQFGTPWYSGVAGRIRFPDVVRMIWIACRRAPGDDFNDIRVWLQYLRIWVD